jgi:hydrogenase maturation protease
MNKKLIAIGNRIMKDDGIAILVAESLYEKFVDKEFEVIIAETDIDFGISSFKKNDFIIMMDATYYGIEPGSVTVSPFNEMKDYIKQCFSQHDMNLLNLLSTYFPTIKGYFLGIEIDEVEFGLELSQKLQSQFKSICKKVENNIDWILEGLKNA